MNELIKFQCILIGKIALVRMQIGSRTFSVFWYEEWHAALRSTKWYMLFSVLIMVDFAVNWLPQTTLHNSFKHSPVPNHELWKGTPTKNNCHRLSTVNFIQLSLVNPNSTILMLKEGLQWHKALVYLALNPNYLHVASHTISSMQFKDMYLGYWARVYVPRLCPRCTTAYCPVLPVIAPPHPSSLELAHTPLPHHCS